MIEASANIGENLVCVCVWEFALEFRPLGSGLPPPFIGSRRGGVHARNVLGFVILSPNRGEQLAVAVAVAEYCEAWLWASPSSWGAVDYAWDVSLPCGASGRRGDCCRAYFPLRLTGRSAEGAADGGLAPVKGRTAFEGRCPCPLKVLRLGKVQGVGGTVAGVSGKSAQSSTVPPRAGNSGTVVGAG